MPAAAAPVLWTELEGYNSIDVSMRNVNNTDSSCSNSNGEKYTEHPRNGPSEVESRIVQYCDYVKNVCSQNPEYYSLTTNQHARLVILNRR